MITVHDLVDFFPILDAPLEQTLFVCSVLTRRLGIAYRLISNRKTSDFAFL